MCHSNHYSFGNAMRNNCSCSCKKGTDVLSKKKRVQVLKQYQDELLEKADDIKEYIKEIESS